MNRSGSVLRRFTDSEGASLSQSSSTFFTLTHKQQSMRFACNRRSSSTMTAFGAKEQGKLVCFTRKLSAQYSATQDSPTKNVIWKRKSIAIVGNAYKLSQKIAGMVDRQPRTKAIIVVMVVTEILSPMSCIASRMRSAGSLSGSVRKYAPVMIKVSSRPTPKTEAACQI